MESKLIKNYSLSRREFITESAKLGAAAYITSSSFPNIASAQKPNKGGVLRAGIGHGSTTDSLDPGKYENNFMFTINYAMHNHLVELDSAGNLIPELAESFESSTDAKQWIFKLRKDVEFHDGKTLDANDVVASFNYHRGEASTSRAKPILSPIANIKADGPNTVIFDLSSANADFPYVVFDFSLAIKPSVEGKIDPLSDIGTGGYVLRSFEPGVRASLERNSNYWKAGHANFDSIELIAIIDTSARTNALRGGDIDVMDRCDLKTVHLLKRLNELDVKVVSGWQHYTLPMNTTQAPFSDNNVRMALKHAVNREALVESVLQGYGDVGNDHPISSTNKYFNAELPQRGYDPEKAKWYLQQAGIDSLDVDLHAADAAFGGAIDAAALYKEHANASGININIVREPNDGYWSDVWMKKNWCFSYWLGQSTPDEMFTMAYAQDAPWNETYWKHERFNELLLRGRSELDETNRKQIYAEMQQILGDEGGAVVPMFANYVFATSSKVQHGQLANNWDMDGMKFAERWWFG